MKICCVIEAEVVYKEEILYSLLHVDLAFADIKSREQSNKITHWVWVGSQLLFFLSPLLNSFASFQDVSRG